VARLRRIVNVTNLSLDGAKDVNGRVLLNARFLATSFMFVEKKDAGAKAGGSPK
jgi:type IV pilus assembly protein PilO